MHHSVGRIIRNNNINVIYPFRTSRRVKTRLTSLFYVSKNHRNRFWNIRQRLYRALIEKHYIDTMMCYKEASTKTHKWFYLLRGESSIGSQFKTNIEVIFCHTQRVLFPRYLKLKWFAFTPQGHNVQKGINAIHNS